MNNPFEILTGFLERHGGEVEGRQLEEPPTSLQSKLRDFARGTLPSDQQEPLLEELRQHPEWIGLLAREIRAARPAGGEQRSR